MKGNVFASLVSITNGLHRDNRSEREFDILNSELKELPKANNAVFKVNFKRPLNSKKEYYFKLISNDTETELAALKSQFSKDATEPENKYNYTVQFNKFNKYLKDIATYIKKQSISNDLGNDTDYIINYLKVSAIRLYAELQELYGHFTDTALFSIQEIAEKYFNDADFDTSIFEKLEAVKKEVVKKTNKPKSKPKTSFGYKNRDTSNLLPVIKQLHFRIELLDNRTTPEQLEKLLLAENFNNIDYKIYLQCETTQFSYVIKELKSYFHNLKPATIERSGKFITKTGAALRAGNLYKNKIDNPKEKEEIDKTIQQLQ
ncbi:hypothetical protein EVU94_08190 [Flavobacteriaceae bacterium 144Ye]|nr:hypothetical protein EVU94_08190 [Flavobacteriaceae bacterium 144Ye]